MDDDLTTGGPGGPGSEPRWPTALPLPALEPLDWEDLAELRAGDLESDRMEALAVLASRGRGALDLAIGDGLAAMKRGDRLISLGFSGVGDYAREVLGIQPRTAQNMAKLSRELRKRPLLRAAVRSGEVRIRNAQVVLPVAIGDAEAEWVELARSHTVRSLEEMVRKARRGSEEDDRWARLQVDLSPEKRAMLDDALDLAGAILGPASTRAQRLEALSQEQLGGHPVDSEEPSFDSVPSQSAPCEGATVSMSGRLARSIRELSHPQTESCERAKERLEVETEQWSFLPKVPGLSVPEVPFDELTSAGEIDAALRKLQVMRMTWDGAMGHAACAIKTSGLHRLLGFANFGHFCEERLGLGKRTVEQRAAVEKRLWEVPALREAFLAHRLSYEQVRLISRLPDGQIPGWIEKAQDLTCVELRRALDEKNEAQMRAVGCFRADVPLDIALTISDAIRSARSLFETRVGDGDCLVAMAANFLDIWSPLAPRRKTMSQRVRERDGGLCQVPMCSRPAEHAHHIEFLSQGGPDTMENQLADCGCHHLRGIHGGYIRLTKTRDGKLEWVIAGRVWEGARKWREQQGVGGDVMGGEVVAEGADGGEEPEE